jgi:hypothetical protein
LPWPFGKNGVGYGTFQLDGRSVLVHRLACEAVHGRAPADKPIAAHWCGNRCCANPQHLRWATQAENMADKVTHGTAQRGEKHGGAKLTWDEVREIRSLLNAGHYGKDVARQFGVSKSTISFIRRGQTWANM